MNWKLAWGTEWVLCFCLRVHTHFASHNQGAFHLIPNNVFEGKGGDLVA